MATNFSTMTDEQLGARTAELVFLMVQTQEELDQAMEEAGRRFKDNEPEVPEEQEDEAKDAEMLEELNMQVAAIPTAVLREWAEELRDGLVLHRNQHRANVETTVDCEENEANSEILFAILRRAHNKGGMN